MADRLPSVDPNRLTPAQAAKVVSAASRRHVDATVIESDVASGAPVGPDGTINLAHYSAWPVREMGRGE